MLLRKNRLFEEVAAKRLTVKLSAYREAFSIKDGELIVTPDDVIDALKRVFCVMYLGLEYQQIGYKKVLTALRSFNEDEVRYHKIMKALVAFVADKYNIDNPLLIDSIAHKIGEFVIPEFQHRSEMVLDQTMSHHLSARGVLYGGGLMDYLSTAVHVNRDLINESGSIWVSCTMAREDLVDAFARNGIEHADVRFFDASPSSPKLSLGSINSTNLLELMESVTNEHQNSVILVGHRQVFLTMYKEYILESFMDGIPDALSLSVVVDKVVASDDAQLIDFIERLLNESRGEGYARYKVGEDLVGIDLEQWRWLFADSMEAYNTLVQYCASDGVDIVSASKNHLVFSNNVIANLISKIISLQVLDSVALKGGCDFRVMFLEDCMFSRELAVRGRSYGLGLNHFFSGYSRVEDMGGFTESPVSDIYSMTQIKVDSIDNDNLDLLTHAMRRVSVREGALSSKLLLV